MNADDLSYGLNQEIYHKSGNLWNDGWYLYSSGEVSGPYSARDIFPGKPTPESSSDKFLVSRKGLSRWYELGILRQIYMDSSSFLREARHSTKGKKQKKDSRSHKKPKIRGKVIGFEKKSSAPDSLAKKKNPDSAPSPKKTRPVTVTRQEAPKNPKPAEKICPENVQTVDYYHLILKGRLRLGNIQSPAHAAFTKFFISMGLAMKTWYEQALVETTFHLDDPMVNARISRAWMVLVPVIHTVMFYRLARLILQMEVQNHYKKTSPLLAMLLSLIPPLSVYYLQKSMNRHWILHVAHAVDIRQKTSG